MFGCIRTTMIGAKVASTGSIGHYSFALDGAVTSEKNEVAL
jgi:hypothetical protein